MVIELALAAQLSCREAQGIINRMESEHYTRKQYTALVDVIARSAPRHCLLTARPGLYRGQTRRPVRVVRRPRRPVVIQPTVVWRF